MRAPKFSDKTKEEVDAAVEKFEAEKPRTLAERLAFVERWWHDHGDQRSK